MIHVSAAEIESKWVGETEKIIKGLFNLGSMVAPSIIFIDEADSMLRKRQSDDGNYYRSRINTFLGQTDGLIHADRPPFLLLATNHPNELDEAVLRRVPGKLYIGMPTTTARNNMLAIFLREEKMEPEMRLSDIAAMTSGFTGSDIRSLCVQAALISQAESREKKEKDDKRVLRFVHFEEAMRRCAPTVSGDALDAIREFARKFDDSAMDKLGNSYNKEGLEKRKEKVKKAPRAIPDWVTSGDVGPGGNSTLSFDDWKNSDLYPYVTEELCQEWWQDSQEILE